MSDSSSPKSKAAVAAAALVRNGMIVGLGSGTTAALIVEALGQRMAAEELTFVGVATSDATAALASSFQIPLKDLDDVDMLDINLDGADEIDSHFRMIKGRGGALLREKIVATVARKRVTVITAEKRVERLGLIAPIPVEVSLLGSRHIETRLRSLGAKPTLRTTADGGPFHTDGGNRIVDCHFRDIEDPAQLEIDLKQTIGVFETGLFIGLCDILIVGHEIEVEVIETGAARVASF